MEAKKLGSKRRKKQKRELESMQSSNPTLKSVHRERRDAAKQRTVQVNVDASELPHSKPGWIGKILAQDGSEAPELGPSPAQLPSGLGAHSYTQEEIDLMSGTKDFSYLAWSGEFVFHLCSTLSFLTFLGISAQQFP